jgi:hypothetical protein
LLVFFLLSNHFGSNFKVSLNFFNPKIAVFNELYLSHAIMCFCRYDSAVAQGIRPHVDQGAYSVNCWLSPNHARDEPMHNGDNVKHSPDTKVGGLRLYRGPGVEGEALATALQEVFSATQEGTSSTSKDRSNDDDGEILRRANQDFRSLKAVVDAATARGMSEQVDVAYKQNRCVLFESRLLHETSPTLNFRSGYRRRRINLTFMFGNSL